MKFDYIIVGAGAAGSVLANRLTASGRSNVLLIEAGQDIVPGQEPADIKSSFPVSAFNERYMWPDTLVHWRTQADSPRIPLPQGRIVGGSSNLMGMYALRGRPEDYDEWEHSGAKGWGWSGVLPYFKRLETDVDFDGPLHGKSGPVPIRREPPEQWSGLARAVQHVCGRRGLPLVDDANGDFRDGHCMMPVSRYENSRASGGICYLTASVRARPNLQLLTECCVARVVMEGRRATGVVAVLADGTEREYLATETVITAGALRSPILLMRSGIGPAADLRQAGTALVVDLPGVGQNLQNHWVLMVMALLRGEALDPRSLRSAGSTFLRWSSGLPGTPPSDMAIFVRSNLAWHALGRRLVALQYCLERPASVGQVRFDCAAPGEARIEFNSLSDARDIARLKEGMRSMMSLFDEPEVAALTEEPIVPGPLGKLQRFNRLSRFNAFRGWCAASLLSTVRPVGRALLYRLGQMTAASELLRSDATLEQFVRSAAVGTGHVCGTCRMGDPSDTRAVVDTDGRVIGVSGLRVADASVMPCVPSGNTHIPVLMVAEKLSAAMLSDGAGASA